MRTPPPLIRRLALGAVLGLAIGCAVIVLHPIHPYLIAFFAALIVSTAVLSLLADVRYPQ